MTLVKNKKLEEPLPHIHGSSVLNDVTVAEMRSLKAAMREPARRLGSRMFHYQIEDLAIEE